MVAQPCPTLCKPMDCGLPGSSVHGILQARVLEWVAISFSIVWVEHLVMLRRRQRADTAQIVFFLYVILHSPPILRKRLIKALEYFLIFSPQSSSYMLYILMHHYQTFSGNKMWAARAGLSGNKSNKVKRPLACKYASHTIQESLIVIMIYFTYQLNWAESGNQKHECPGQCWKMSF